VVRKEDKRLLTGHGSYAGDLTVPRMLHGAFLRSDVASAKIVSVDTSEARAFPGVVEVFTAAEFDGHFGVTWSPILGEDLPMPPPLAVTDVRYVGDPIALVVAESRYVAEDACELIRLELEPTDSCVDFFTATDDATHLVHGDSGRTSNVMREVPFTAFQPDLDEAFSSAAHVVDAEIVSNRYLAMPMETRGVVASWEPVRDEIDITCSCQKVHQARETFARFLKVPERKVRVWARDVGGGFGQKSFMWREECSVILASRLLGQPVKWIEDRRENLLSAAHARHEYGHVRLAIDDDRVIQAIAIDHLADVGAYPPCPATMNTGLLPGPYKIPRMGFSSRLVWTNTMGIGAYRGPWLFETTAREMAIDHAARVLGIDPIELRRKNLLSAADLPFTSPSGNVFKEMTPLETLERAVEMLDYEAFRAEQAEARAQGRLLGVGCCAYVEPTASGPPTQVSEGALVRVENDGQVVAYLGTTSQGQSVETTMAQIVADTLGVDYDDVTIIQGASAMTPYGRGTGGSGSAVIAGGAALQAAELVRERVLAVAAQSLEANPADLTIEAGRVFVRGTPSKAMTMREVATAAYRFDRQLPGDMATELEATVRFRPSSFPTWSNATHLCVVEIDRETCVPRVLRYVAAEDCGRIINPRIADGQVYGGVIQGMGGVLLEDFVYDPDGNPLTSTLVDYLMPSTTEVPHIEIGHIETPSTTNPGGYKGIGEGGAIGSHAAVANAVADALAHLGIHATKTPLGPNDIHRLLVSAGHA
jgi:carbon-monoxide dehydrogenase large subunit